MTRLQPSASLQRLLSRTARPPDSILLVVAHYDDEIAGVGGQLARWAPYTTLVHVTDSAPADGADARAAGFSSPRAYGQARRHELGEALSCLPQPVKSAVHLDVPDREVTTRLLDVIDALGDIVRAARPAVLVTHAYEGGHPDHDALSFAARALRLATDAPPFDVIEFAEYHENGSGSLVTNAFPDTPSVTAPLLPGERRLKRLMLACFRSQVRVLAPFGWSAESLRAARLHDYSQPPASGRVWFDRLGWEMTGARWRATIAEITRSIGSEGAQCSPF